LNMTGESEKILVIDDEERMCRSLKELLEGDGFHVTTTQDPVEAMELINRDPFDLIITDIKMPKMSGLEILHTARRANPDMEVILMTGYASLESSLDAIREGAFEYLLKPVEFSQLRISVKRALEKRESGLSQKRLLEDLRQVNLNLNNRLNEINALYEAGKSLVAASSVKELLNKIVNLAAGVTEAEIGSLMLIDQSGEFLTIEAYKGLNEELVRTVRLPVGESIAGYVAQKGEPLFIDNLEEDERFRRINKERYTTASLLCVPLRLSDKILGVVNMANKKGGVAFTEHDLKLLSTFASQAAIFIDDARQAEDNLRKLMEFKVLFDLSQQLSRVGSVSAMRSTVFEYLKKLMPIDYALWFEWQPGLLTLRPVGATGTDLPLTDTGSIKLDEIREEDIILDNVDFQGVDIEDAGELSCYLAGKIAQQEAFPSPGNNFAALPVIQEGELKHVLCIGTGDEQQYKEQDISLARLIISLASGFYEREKGLLNATRLLTMGNMISEISHDLRRPLTNIKGSIQIIKDKFADVIGDSELFGIAEDEIHRLDELVHELVDFSKPHKYETEITDIRKIIHRAAELIGPELRRKNIEFSEVYDDCRWEVAINKNQILEVFLNLILNSVDAVEENGRISVTGKLDRPSFKKSEYLAIKISDNGHGIKKENLSKIFDRYYTTKKTGTGLGLAVVERIMSAHGGTLDVKSESGVGTDFTLYFPV
jgi:signal transduction histidine kinase/CheY-like chemotaxis protein